MTSQPPAPKKTAPAARARRPSAASKRAAASVVVETAESDDDNLEDVVAPAPSAAPAASDDSPRKAPKLKLAKPVRDSFTLPKAEHQLIDLLKKRAASKQRRKVRKSDILRAGILALADMSDEQLFAAIDAVPAGKAGRR